MDRDEMLQFSLQLVRGRWFVLFASFCIMVGAGATYLFGSYSKMLKTTFDYNQKKINTMGFAKDLGSNMGIISGLLSEFVPDWGLLVLGGTTNFFSYFLMWLAVTHRSAQPKFWEMCTYIGIATNSQNFVNTAVLVSCVRNFPERRGIVLGLLKGFVGLSGAIMTQLYYAFYGPDQPGTLVLFLGWFPSVLCLIFVCTIRTVKPHYSENPNELRAFYQFLYMSILLAVILMVLGLTQKTTEFSQNAYVGGAAVIIVLLILPLVIAIREELEIWNNKKCISPATSVKSIDNEPRNEVPEEPLFIYSNIWDKPERGEDYTILQALFSKDMLLLIISIVLGSGSTLAAIDNLGQVCESLKYPTHSVGFILSLVSIWNFFGRILSGFLSEFLLDKYQFPRPLVLSIVFLISCMGHLIIAFPFSHSVYVASLLIGLTFGAEVTCLFSIVSELFGLRHFALLFNCMQMFVPIGSYLLNVEVIGILYDKEAVKGGAHLVTGRGLTCIGAHCFAQSFAILATVTFLGAVSALVLAIRTRSFYRSDIYKRFREDLTVPKSEMEFYRLNVKKINSDKFGGKRFESFR